MRFLLKCLALGGGLGLSVHLSAAVVSFSMPDTPDFTTVPAAIPDGGFQNNGIWLTMTSPTPVIISDFSFPGLVDGQFQLRTTIYGGGNAAEFLVQGLFGNGNDVAVAGSGPFPSNPAYLPTGSTVGPDSDFIAGMSFTALSGDFGNWIAAEPLRGALGVSFANGSDLHYGFIDITILTDGRVTLHGYAFDSTPNTPITTFAIPEPSTYALLFGVLALGAVGLRRRLRA